MSSFPLPGKVAIVTGSARGIGYEIARQLHERGAYVVVNDLDEEATTRAAKSIGERALGVPGDVTDVDAMDDLAAKAIESFGGIDLVVANAGVAPPGATLRNIEPNAFERVLDIDLYGVWRSVKPALPQIVERGGHVVVISSVYAWMNGVLVGPYAVAKAGVEALGRTLRAELAVHGASAGVAHFGFIDTAMVRQGFDEDPLTERFANTFPAFMRRRLPTSAAARGVIEGIERRAPRTIVPRWWGVWFALRGILNPLLDKRMERGEEYLTLLKEADDESRPHGLEGMTRTAGADDAATPSGAPR